MDDPREPPPRPGTWAELGFSPRRSVQWFRPKILAIAAGRVVLSATFGAYLDKRELQQGLAGDVLSDHAGRPEVWLDYPDLLAIPGNHDWYDGLTGFMRIFGPAPLDRWPADQAEPQLLRRPAASPMVAVGDRHPVRRLRRRTADRVLPGGGAPDAPRGPGRALHRQPSWSPPGCGCPS